MQFLLHKPPPQSNTKPPPGVGGAGCRGFGSPVGPASHPLTGSRTQAGKGLGSPGLHRNAPQGTAPAAASFSDPAEIGPLPPESVPVSVSEHLSFSLSHTHTLSRTDPHRHTLWCEPLLALPCTHGAPSCPLSATRPPIWDTTSPPLLHGFQAVAQHTRWGGSPNWPGISPPPSGRTEPPTLQVPPPPQLWSLWEPDSWGRPAGLASSQASGDWLREEGAAETEASVAACPRGGFLEGTGLPD